MEPNGPGVAEAAGEETVAKAQARVIALAEAASALRSRIESIDSELDRLVETLRSAGARIADELRTVECDVAALYAAAGVDRPGAPEARQLETPGVDRPGAPEAPQPETPGVDRPGAPEARQPETPETPATDLEGARLTALNMALNGDSRAATARCLAEHFGLSQPDELIEEVYSAVES